MNKFYAVFSLVGITIFSSSITNANGFNNNRNRVNQTVTNQAFKFSRNVTTACDRPWTTHILSNHRNRKLVPNAIYNTSCTTDAGEKKMFTSLTIKDGRKEKGMIIESVLQGNKMVPTGVVRKFAECEEMHGIAASNNCTVVGALCRRDSRNPRHFKKDLVAEYPVRMWRDLFTQAIKPNDSYSLKQRKNSFDTEWIYEWSNGQVLNEPDKYVLHKAIGGWEYGRQDLVFSDTQNSYGAFMKTAVGRHESDTFMIVKRQNNEISRIDNRRGWKNSCAAGHTIFNHAVFNPYTKTKNKRGRTINGAYAGICATDYGAVHPYKRRYAGLWVSVEKPGHLNGTEKGFMSIPMRGHDFAGGVTSMLPMQDGGFLGVIAGVQGRLPAPIDFKKYGPTTDIGIVRFDSKGNATRVKWVVKDRDWFYSSPQIASLGNGKYLLGYSKTARLSDQNRLTVYNDAVRMPSSFHVVEIDENGNRLTTELAVEQGWGDQDRMVSIADGKVAWAYIPNAAYKTQQYGDRAAFPNCEANELLLNLYQSQ